MNEDSGFFKELSSAPHRQTMEMIHSSDSGWAELYRWDRSGRFRVLKALKPEFRGQIKYEEALRKEFEIGYSLSHPGICEVYGFMQVKGLGNCIEMEWIDGIPLSEFISSRQLSKTFSKRVILQLCEALHYIHSKQIIHRDIKPSNILITHNGHNVKLIDVGLSDIDSSTIFKTPAGTVSFAAPEVLNDSGVSADARSDIYSLGKVISMLSPAYSSVARKCMKSEPDQRYHDVGQVVTDIEGGKSPLKSVIVLLLAASIIVTALVTIHSYTSDSPIRHQDAAPQEDQAVIDTSAIDEIFRQATDMMMSDEH